MARANRLTTLGKALAAELANANNGSVVELPLVARFHVQVTEAFQYALPTGEPRTRPPIHRFILFTAPSLLCRLDAGDMKRGVEPTDLGWIERAGLSREEAMEVLAELADRLASGETVHLTGFGRLKVGGGAASRRVTAALSPTGHRVLNSVVRRAVPANSPAPSGERRNS